MGVARGAKLDLSCTHPLPGTKVLPGRGPEGGAGFAFGFGGGGAGGVATSWSEVDFEDFPLEDLRKQYI